MRLLPSIFGAILVLLVTGSSGATTAAPLAPVELSPAVTLEVDLPIEGEVVLTRTDAAEEPPLRLSVRSKTPILLNLPTGSTWEVSARLPGFWVQ